MAFWSLLTALCLFALRVVPGTGTGLRIWSWLTLLTGLFFCVPAVSRWMRWKLLWRLRNRLFVTYLLIGVTPVVLLGVLAAGAAYVLFGQFANFAATSEIETQLLQLSANNESLARHIQHALLSVRGALAAPHAGSGGISSSGWAQSGEIPPEVQTVLDVPELRVGLYIDGNLRPFPLPPDHALTSAQSPPGWIKDGFRGLTLDQEHVFFRAITREQANGHIVTVVTSLPLDAGFLGRVASGLGKISLLPKVRIAENAVEYNQRDIKTSAGVPGSAGDRVITSASGNHNSPDDGAAFGGTLPKGTGIFDIPITFPTTVETVDWSTGRRIAVVALVTSRPSLLYQRLFRESVAIGGGVRAAIILAAVVFTCLELLAIFLASRLSRTITHSVSDLYHATREVDQGRLTYRIPVSRHDQLAALSQSFNAMTESLLRLLQEQKEKERLQSEMAIAQEVQANLFPAAAVRVGELELHGLCRPARTVSGDYYDFLVLGHGGLCLAIGDISGKGISAALLMAGLHSAVRAYRFASEELFAGGTIGSQIGKLQDAQGNAIPREAFRSPGNLLRLLNQHLYRSTQPEKYATLFLAYYDAATHVLRYSNGGQLPPLVLRADGSVIRLDQGGTVVGLLDNMLYEEGAVALDPGDILIAYSDGVTEPENEYGDFGEERMLDLVRRNRNLPLEEITHRVMQALDDWIGGEEQPDDITLVLARQH
ncbi:MAG TPA: SpoIIE family protein phosphatase [Acidobacteriaceae bacterium]|nr:SpoIIE family protein phosphatase [Acidobacteriaceae bacterium]